MKRKYKRDLNHYFLLISLDQDSRVTKQKGYWLQVSHTKRKER